LFGPDEGQVRTRRGDGGIRLGRPHCNDEDFNMRTFSRSFRLALPLCLPLFACPADEGGDDAADTTAAPTSGAVSSTGNDSATTNASADGTSGGPSVTTGMPSTTAAPATSDSDGGPPPVYFDLGIIPDSPPYETECGKVDFLFVIDNSGSMGSSQANVLANFPAFIGGIQDSLEGVDSYQVGVVTTDAYTTNIAGCQQLSSLVVQSAGGVCGPYAEGNNFMTQEDDLPTAFACAGNIGTSGSASERPMQAAVEAITRVEGDPGECNEGFIRDDALLVLVIITDEPDANSVGTPMSWYDDIVAAKLGIPENVVVLSLINTPGGACLGAQAPGIAAFTTMFGANGFLADICTPDYGPIFQDAIAVIDIACENFMVPD
jgi:hypothetical protein